MELLLKPLMRLFAALVSRGGDPRPDCDRFGQPNLVYPLRPGTLVFFLCSLAFSIYTLAINVPLLLQGRFSQVHRYQLPLGLLLGILALVMLNRTLSLNDEGIHLRQAFGRSTSIPFTALHHVERYRSSSAGKATWFLRSVPDPLTGRDQTITLPEMTYNVDHLLRSIRERTPLPEQPRQRRHWYGG